jgi:hypothetical protein
VNTILRVCRALAVVGILALSAGAAVPGDRVNELCVYAGDIDYCAPKGA